MLEPESSGDWEGIMRVLEGIDLPYTCIIGAEDLASKIALVLELEGDRQDVMIYPKDKFLQLTKVELARDIFERAQRPIGKKREIIQVVFDHFLSVHEWPSSMQMRVEWRHLGNFFHLAREIGTNFIIVGDEQDPAAVTTLTIYGVRLCAGSDNYLKNFLEILKVLCSRFIETSESPIVSSQELVSGGLISIGEERTIYDMLLREGRFLSGGSITAEGEFNFTVSHGILEYENIQDIDEYIKIAYANRIKKQMKRETSELHDIDLIELSTEGVAVTRKNKKTKFEYDLFISFSSKDQEKANKIDRAARKAELETFMAPKSIKGGEPGIEKIKEAIRESAEVVVLVSKNSLASGWVFAEWGAAWILDKYITPLLYRCDIDQIPDLIKIPQFMDLDDLDEYIQQAVGRKQERENKSPAHTQVWGAV